MADMKAKIENMQSQQAEYEKKIASNENGESLISPSLEGCLCTDCIKTKYSSSGL